MQLTMYAVYASYYYPRRVGGHGYSSLLVCYPRRVGGHGYSSLLVCLFVVCDGLFYSPGCHSTAFTAWIAFTQQYLDLNSGRF